MEDGCPLDVSTILTFSRLINIPLSEALKALEVLPVAAPPPPRQLTEEETRRLEEQEEDTLRDLRLFLRDVSNRLSRDKRFKAFTKPVDLGEVAVPFKFSFQCSLVSLPRHHCTQRSLFVVCFRCQITPWSSRSRWTCQQFSLTSTSIGTGRSKSSSKTWISSGRMPWSTTQTGTPQVPAVGTFLTEAYGVLILNICVMQLFGVFPSDRQIRHKACALKDTVHAIIKDELDEEFEKICVETKASRSTRGKSCVCVCSSKTNVISKL